MTKLIDSEVLTFVGLPPLVGAPLELLEYLEALRLLIVSASNLRMTSCSESEVMSSISFVIAAVWSFVIEDAVTS